MTASKNPTKYPQELSDWTLAAAHGFQVLHFEADSQNERLRGRFQFNNFWKALAVALTKDKALYTEAVRERLAELMEAAQKLTTKDDAEGFGYSMGPTALLRPSTMRLSTPLTPTPTPSEGRVMSTAEVAAALGMEQPRLMPVPERTNEAPLTPVPEPRQATPEEREASRAAAMAGVHKSRMAGMTPHARAAYMMEQRVGADGTVGEVSVDAAPTALVKHAPTKTD